MSKFDALIYGLILGAAVALVATPLAWRFLRTLPHARRALAANLSCVGIAGLAGLGFAKALDLHDDLVPVSVATSAALQGAALLLLLLFSPKRP